MLFSPRISYGWQSIDNKKIPRLGPFATENEGLELESAWTDACGEDDNGY